MILRVNLSKSKVFKRFGILVSLIVKTRVFWLNLYKFCAILTNISDQSVEKQQKYTVLNDRLETSDHN
jgi:hypothetical protein